MQCKTLSFATVLPALPLPETPTPFYDSDIDIQSSNQNLDMPYTSVAVHETDEPSVSRNEDLARDDVLSVWVTKTETCPGTLPSYSDAKAAYTDLKLFI